MRIAPLRLRVAATAGVFSVLFLAVVVRAIQLCVIEGGALRELAGRQQQQRLSIPPDRGPIVDRHNAVLAMTAEGAEIYLRPRALPNSERAVSMIAETLQLPVQYVSAKAAVPERFVWLMRGATREQADAVTALGLPGVGREVTRRRLYPRGSLAGQVLGFAGVDSQGLEGVELAYDRDLRSAPESFSVARDARGRRMLVNGGWQGIQPHGARVELTIDANLQQVAETELESAVSRQKAAAGVAVVMDPFTGEILALAMVPRFDPNRVGEARPDHWRNRVIADSHEPGSTFKAFVGSAALEAGVVRPDDRLFCENGRYAVGGRVVRDHDPYGWLTFADVIRYSSNIGAAKIGERLGAERFGAAIAAFGFGRPTQIDLPGEVVGLVPSWKKWGRINLVTISFGQGIAVTPLQMVRAYAAIAAGGKLMRPYVVRRVIAPDGTVVHENTPQVVGQPISAQTAAIMTRLLRGVVEDGTGTRARLDGIPVAGKTGTAQKVDPRTKRYSPRDRISSFVGFFPAEAPRFVVLVAIDTPRSATYGGIVAAPVFQRIAEYSADRLGLRIAEVATLPATPPSAARQVAWHGATVEQGMPSFIGLSMRQALVEASRAGWEVETSGSGFVTAQDPPPGAVTAKDRRLELRFGSAAG